MKITNKGLSQVQGFSSLGKNIGIKRKKKDFGIIFCSVPCNAAAVYTKNKVKGAPLHITKEHLAAGKAQAISIISGIANVGTGMQGIKDALETAQLVAKGLGIKTNDVLVASTGVIGKRIPMELVSKASKGISSELGCNDGISEAILTTDTVTKQVCVETDGFKIAGIAKGSGMIHPNMATMLAFICTDADIQAGSLEKLLKDSVSSSFNMVNVDMDTSTSDMAIIMANGIAGKVSEAKFKQALDTVCIRLAKMIAKDGEGATKLIEDSVINAKTQENAKRIAKSIVKSNLVKCAIFGNGIAWGRVLCAIGNSGADFEEQKLLIQMNGYIVFENGAGADRLDEAELKKSLAEDPVAKIKIDLRDGNEKAEAYGCDLTYDYVKINAEHYT